MGRGSASGRESEVRSEPSRGQVKLTTGALVKSKPGGDSALWWMQGLHGAALRVCTFIERTMRYFLNCIGLVKPTPPPLLLSQIKRLHPLRARLM